MGPGVFYTKIREVLAAHFRNLAANLAAHFQNLAGVLAAVLAGVLVDNLADNLADQCSVVLLGVGLHFYGIFGGVV